MSDPFRYCVVCGDPRIYGRLVCSDECLKVRRTELLLQRMVKA